MKPAFRWKRASKIQSHAFKVSQQLERKGYAPAVVAVQAAPVEEFVGVIDDEEPATEIQDDPYEAGRKAVEALKEAEGGHVDRTEAARLLDIGLAQLYNRIDQKKVVTWVSRSGYGSTALFQGPSRRVRPGTCRYVEPKLARALIAGEVAEDSAIAFTVQSGELTPVQAGPAVARR